MQLRPYQQKAIELLRTEISQQKVDGRRPRPILCLPTGAGKTVTFSNLTDQAILKGSRPGLVCHRTELVQQAQKTMREYGVDMKAVNFGMVQTYVRSPYKIPKMDVCIIDECHIGNFRRFIDLLIERNPSVQIIGATATPLAASNKKPLNQLFDSVISPVQIKDLIEDGYLSEPEYVKYQIDEGDLVKGSDGEFTAQSQTKIFSEKNLIDQLKQVKDKTIIFCASIDAAENAARLSEAQGIETFLVHSKMDKDLRDNEVEQFKARSMNHRCAIVNCSILTAGFDDPSICKAIIYRATTSLTLWLQMVGRASRIIPGQKERFTIVDMGGNLDRHGYWEMDRDWDRMFREQGKKKKGKGPAPTKECEMCQAIIPVSATVCPVCGAAQKKGQDKAPSGVPVVISSYSQLPENLKKPYSQMTVRELIERAQYGSPRLGRPFKTGWIVSKLKERPNASQALREYAYIKGYKKGWVDRQLNMMQV